MRKRREVEYGYDGGGGERACHCGEESGLVTGVEDLQRFGVQRPFAVRSDDRVIESGPSRITIDDLERLEKAEQRILGSGRQRTTTIGHQSVATSTLRRRRQRPISSVAAAIASLSLLSSTNAAPPLPRPDTSTSTLPISQLSRRQQASTSTSSLVTSAPIPQISVPPQPVPRSDDQAVHFEINYLTSMSTPTHALPTDVYVVDERRLPFYMTQNDDGEWTKVDDAWFLYGRRAGDVSTANFGPDDDPAATANPTSSVSATASFAITDNLPPGWGIEATRSEFYMTPLIVAMSVILALMIVAGIIFIVIKRRKEHRRAKRRAARLRRKALAAAGLTEEDINNNRGGQGIDSGLREKLEEIDKINKTKRKEKERGPTALIRTKVRSWNQGVLRRRKGKAGLGPSRSNTPSIEVIDDDKYDHGSHGTAAGGRGSSDTTRTTPTVASHSSNDRGGFSGSGSGSGEATTSDTNETPSSTDLSRATTQPPTATYFPPAYRPASVRSLQVGRAGGSSTSPEASTSSGSHQQHPITPGPVEKTNAPGYYPAPATEESEQALAVASRSDGKRRVETPPTAEEDEEERRVRHIATDDKQVLERMRMGASAPPQRVATGSDEVDAVDGGLPLDGPSAPDVEVDEQGFERHDPAILHVPPIASDADEPEASSSHLPRPPQRPRMSYRLYSQDDLAASLGVDERHLLPSAPPPAHPDHLMPSAPPMLDVDDDTQADDGGPTPTAPSAPAFDLGEADEAEAEGEDVSHEGHSYSESGAEGGDEYARTDTQDTRYDTPSPPAVQEDDEPDLAIPANQSRNPSLPGYEP